MLLTFPFLPNCELSPTQLTWKNPIPPAGISYLSEFPKGTPTDLGVLPAGFVPALPGDRGQVCWQ